MIDVSKLTTEYFEPFLLERIQKAKEYASLIKNGRNITKLEDIEMSLRYVLSKHYKIPMFHDYFEKLTIDQLFFEAELIVSEYKTHTQTVSETIQENKSEIDSLVEEMESDWNDMAVDESLESDPVFQMAKDFMKTGKFLNEQDSKQVQPFTGFDNEQQEEQEDGNWK